MQTNLRLTLILFCLHPDPLTAQSQKSQNWRIPIVPDNDAETSSAEETDSIQPPQDSARQFQIFRDSLRAESVSVSDQYADAQSVKTSATSQDLLRRLGLIGAGGESGRWGSGRVSIRGHAGSEPTVTVQGALLSSGFSGAHSEELVPLSAISGLRAYPFFPSFGLPNLGIAGGYDFELFSARQPEQQTSFIAFEYPQAVNTGGRYALRCSESNCLQLSWGGNFFRGKIEVLDDRNTPQVSGDDRTDRLNFADVSRLSWAARHRWELGTGGRLDSTLIVGAEGRGTSGLPVSSVSDKNRLSRTLVFASQEYSHLSPVSGFFGSGRLSASQQSGRFNQDLQNSSALIRSDQRNETAVNAAGQLSIPVNVSNAVHRLLLESSLESNTYRSTVSVSAQGGSSSGIDDSNLSGELVRVSAAAGVFLQPVTSADLLLNASIQNGNAQMDRRCGAFSPAVLCAEKNWKSSENAFGYVAQWTRRFESEFILFVHGGRTARLPRPLEIAGRPDGILANPDLRSEQTNAGEIGVRSRFARLSFFAADDKNLISAEQVSPFLLRYENTPVVRRSGISADGGLRFRDCEITGNFEKVSAGKISGRPNQRVIPFIPEYWYRVSFAGLKIAGASSAFLDFEQSGPYWLDSAGGSSLAPPGIFSARTATSIKTLQGQLELSLSLRNLFDNRLAFLALSDGTSRKVPWSLSPVLPVQGRSIEVHIRLLNQ
jgi:hypothetical protein